MKTTVLDASVAAKWFLPSAEPLRKQALTLLDSYRAGQLRFVVPDLFGASWLTFFGRHFANADGNNLTQKMRLGWLANASFRLFRQLIFSTEPCKIAMAFDRSVYDSVYIAAALATNSELVTSDERLANAVAATLRVKWLGSIH